MYRKNAVLAAIIFMISTFTVAGQEYTVRVIEQKPLPRELFVQGMEFSGDDLLISSGLYGRSRLLRMNFDNDGKMQGLRLDPRAFAEGLTQLDGKIYQLTWRNGMLFIYDSETLQELDRWPLPGEGWGMANNGRELIYGDGSDRLFFLHPENGRLLRTLKVSENARPVTRLNELEWVDGSIWANIWGSDDIVIIDPTSGNVTGRINLAGLLPEDHRLPDTDVLNGIARHPKSGAIWVTGKRWPWLYQVELVEKIPGPATAQERDSR